MDRKLVVSLPNIKVFECVKIFYPVTSLDREGCSHTAHCCGGSLVLGVADNSKEHCSDQTQVRDEREDNREIMSGIMSVVVSHHLSGHWAVSCGG